MVDSRVLRGPLSGIGKAMYPFKGAVDALAGGVDDGLVVNADGKGLGPQALALAGGAWAAGHESLDLLALVIRFGSRWRRSRLGMTPSILCRIGRRGHCECGVAPCIFSVAMPLLGP